MVNRWLFTHIDNSPLIVFRILFGFLISAEAIGAIATGWVRRTLVEPKFTFNFIGFEFLQPLPGNGMYYYFAVMGGLGLMVMIGYRYRWSMVAYAVLWTGVYLMQKSAYNNHYYLMVLLCFLMVALPAGDYFSVDAKRNPSIQRISMPRWCIIIIIGQLWIVYTYASIAKLYPDWLDFTVARNLMRPKADMPVIGAFLQQHWVHGAIAYAGILFDLFVIPLLLWKRTRLLIFCVSIFFHLFNSIVFQIGIFPYLSLAFNVFFFSRETVHQIFMRKKEFYKTGELRVPTLGKFLAPVMIVWFVIQVMLPLRHWVIPGDVLWTEEGHRLSWRMMLRQRSGITNFYVQDKNNPEGSDERVVITKRDYLTKKQVLSFAAKPDMIWQFAQHLKKEYASKGQDVAVYVDSRVSVNSKPYKPFIDRDIDIASVQWNRFSSNPWVIKYNQ